jgi:hypothetical protein
LTTSVTAPASKTAVEIWTPPDATKIPVRSQSYVIGLFGKKGSGKSIVLCYFGLDAIEHGRQVYYYPRDYGLVGGTPMEPEELVSIPEKLDGATVLIDEIQELLSKYRTNTLASQNLMAMFRQVRKRSSDVIFTSNDPGSINHGVVGQTDIHGFCTFYQDHRCDNREFHLKSCDDLVVTQWTDTQGAHGTIPDRKDGRKRYPAMLPRVKRFYGYYNTESIADPVDLYKISKRTILASQAEEKLGMTWAEFDDLLRNEIVPSLVFADNPVTTIVPGGFVRLLMRERKINIDPTSLGVRLASLGLTRTRNSRNNTYALPPADRMLDWQDGLWNASDPDA